MLSSIARRLAGVLVVVAITIALCEAVAFVALQNLEPPAGLNIYKDELVSGGNVLAVRPNLNQHWRTDAFDVTVRTNAGGYREDFDFSLAGVEVAFMGDSFAFGHGVEAEQHYSALFASRIGAGIDPRRVVSLAYNNGFQPEHYEYFLRRHPQLRPKLIVIGLYLGNDLEPDVKETRFDRETMTVELPYRSVEVGAIVNATPYRLPFFRRLVSFSSTARLSAILINRSIYRKYLFRDDAIFSNSMNSPALEFGEFNGYADRSFESLVNIGQIARQRGGGLVVMVIPQNFYAGAMKRPHLDPALLPNIPQIVASGGLRAAVVERCGKLGLDCIDLGGVITADDFFPTDAHWNAKGHRKAAEALVEHVGKTGVLRP
jgi:hypothetical protein